MHHDNLIIKIGFIFNRKEEHQFKSLIHKVRNTLLNDLQKSFKNFNWIVELIERKDFPEINPPDPIILLDYGSSLKLEYNLDFSIVITSDPLKPRFSQFVNAVPSNFLESAVVSFSRILENEEENQISSMVNLIKHNLGHLWGLDHSENSVMKPFAMWNENRILDWNEEEKKHINQYLNEIADPRLEETTYGAKLTRFLFYLKFLKKEGMSILKDIIFLKSFLTVVHLSKFIATIIISTIFLFLTGEFWELGASINSGIVNFSIILVLFLTTFSLYFGHNLHRVARFDRLKEQAVRSKLIIFGTLFTGITAIWLIVFVICIFIIFIFPEKVLLHWAGLNNHLPVLHFAKIISTFGILMSAFGGNLEEEDDLKAILFYTEET